MKVAHIGIAVESIENASAFYRDILGAKFEGIEEVLSQKVKIAVWGMDGVKIELLEAMSQDSPISRFVEKRGAGIHHIAFWTGNIEKTIDRLRSSGYAMTDEKPRKGLHDTRVVFLHPKSTGGVLVELVEQRSPEK